MKMKTIFAAAALLLLVFAPVPAASAQDLVILHTNDTHSQIEEVRVGRGAGTGGVHRRAEYFRQVLDQYGKDHVLIVDAGDYNQGTPYFTVFGGDPSATTSTTTEWTSWPAVCPRQSSRPSAPTTTSPVRLWILW